TQQHVVGADLCADVGDRVFGDLRRGPQGFAAADVEDETRQEATALLGVGHFRVELHAVVSALIVEHAGDRAARGAGQDVEIAWHFGDLVTVAHPYAEAEQAVSVDVVFDAVEQAALADYINAGITELTQLGTFNLAA